MTTAAEPLARANLDQRRAADPRASVWVAASAGSGKTKVLTDRVLSLLLHGSPADKILCLTFTKAAAAETILKRLAAGKSALRLRISFPPVLWFSYCAMAKICPVLGSRITTAARSVLERERRVVT